MKQLVKIAIAEDHKLVRQGFVRMLLDYPNIKVLFEASNGKELLRHLKEFNPKIILLDIVMPGLGGLQAMEIIRKRYPKLKIIAISQIAEEISIVECARAGAHAFLNKNCDVEELVAAIYALDQNGLYFDEKTTKLLVKYGVLQGQSNKRELSEKEAAILRYMYENKTLQDIAESTGDKLTTVYFYVDRLKHKTNCKDLQELISYAKNRHFS